MKFGIGSVLFLSSLVCIWILTVSLHLYFNYDCGAVCIENLKYYSFYGVIYIPIFICSFVLTKFFRR